MRDLSATERVLKSGMEQAAKAVFSAQAEEMVRRVRAQVERSAAELESASRNVKRKVFVTRWSELAAAFLLGVLAAGVFGYYEVKQPLDKIYDAQAVLYGQMKQLTAQPTTTKRPIPARLKPAPTPHADSSKAPDAPQP